MADLVWRLQDKNPALVESHHFRAPGSRVVHGLGLAMLRGVDETPTSHKTPKMKNCSSITRLQVSFRDLSTSAGWKDIRRRDSCEFTFFCDFFFIKEDFQVEVTCDRVCRYQQMELLPQDALHRLYSPASGTSFATRTSGFYMPWLLNKPSSQQCN